MTPRKLLKFLFYGYCPGVAGKFPYFGTQVFFPRGCLLFRLACQQGVFESENLRLLQQLIRPKTLVFDVGANIGLMAAPLLQGESGVQVVSFEPSPNSLPWLRKTVEGSPYKDRWAVIPKAVGSRVGMTSFSLSELNDAAFDGIQPTNRVGQCKQIDVEMTTLDTEWAKLGSPEVSAIKIDVEGGEIGVLEGASACLAKTRAPILLEWNAKNLKAYRCPTQAILDFAASSGYRIYAIPSMHYVAGKTELTLLMRATESFLLAPITHAVSVNY